MYIYIYIYVYIYNIEARPQLCRSIVPLANGAWSRRGHAPVSSLSRSAPPWVPSWFLFCLVDSCVCSFCL